MGIRSNRNGSNGEMMVTIKNATSVQIQNALDATNKIFSNNIRFNRFDKIGKSYSVTLKAISSRKPGGRISIDGIITGHKRYVNAACWHVHGVFFDELFKQSESIAVISSTRNGKQTITKDSGNWSDVNVGSVVHPVLYSDACECYGNIDGMY